MIVPGWQGRNDEPGERWHQIMQPWTAASQGKGHADFHVPREELEKVPVFKGSGDLTKNCLTRFARRVASGA